MSEPLSIATALRSFAAAFTQLADVLDRPQPQARPVAPSRPGWPKPGTKTRMGVDAARRPEGASDREMVAITGWAGGPLSWKPWFVRADGTGMAQRCGLHYESRTVDGENRHFLTSASSP
jgi:hypothetical protein